VSEPADTPTVEVADRAAWAGWLSANHDSVVAIWLKIAKKGSPTPTVSQAEAIDEAVCFGWIDGQVRRLDEHFYVQRFTPRRRASRWSQVNRERAQRLIADGRMKPSGMVEYEAAAADGRLDAAYAPQSQASPAADFAAALAAAPDALAFFDGLKSIERYAFIYRLHHVTDPDRRAARISEYVQLLGEQRTLHERA
jgi:uncharacterized protein YdeI (YjbR/CyaY-like superfamily)